MSDAQSAIKHHFRQLLMHLYQSYLESGHTPEQAKEQVRFFLDEVLRDWPAGETLRGISPLPLLRRAMADAKALGHQGEGIYRTLVDLEKLLSKRDG